MKKFIFSISISLLTIFATQVFAKSITVTNMLEGGKITFTPGNNYFWGVHSCSYNWGGSKEYKFDQFMKENISSYSYDTVIIGTNTRCINIKTDVVNFKVDIPYVNQEAFKNSDNPPKQNQAGVVFASSPEMGTVFRLSPHPTERNTTNIEAGIPFTKNHFRCEIHNDNLALKWLKLTGIETELTKGWVLDISWITSHKHCFVKSLTFNPKLLTPSPVAIVPVPPTEPLPPITCVQ